MDLIGQQETARRERDARMAKATADQEAAVREAAGERMADIVGGIADEIAPPVVSLGPDIRPALGDPAYAEARHAAMSRFLARSA